MHKNLVRGRAFDFDGGGVGGAGAGGGDGRFGLGKSFFPQTSGDIIFFLTLTT